MRMVAIALSAAVLGFVGCNCDMDHGRHDEMKHDGMKHEDGVHTMKKEEKNSHMGDMMMNRDAMMAKNAVVVIYPTKGSSVSGSLTFTDTGNAVKIQGTIKGLEPNSTHAMHIHEFGDQTSDNGMSAGSHYNPGKHAHGAPGSPEHHAGDFGNIKADNSGTATIDLTVNDISIAGLKGKPGILGRGIVIHEKPDDFGQPVGNAGGRIGVGVIGVAKAPQ